MTTDFTARKSIAQDLDRAAARAEYVDAAPATAKQCWYLAGLLAQLGETAADVECGCAQSNAVLTKKRASMYIDLCLEDIARRAAA